MIAEAIDERDPEEARPPRISGLDPRGRAWRELAAWRERTAAAEDRLVGSVATRRWSSSPSGRRPA